MPSTSTLTPTLTSLICSPTSVSGSASSICTATLSSATNSPTTITLSSNNTAVTLPQSVTISSGSTSAQFFASNTGVASASVTVTATLGGISKIANLTVSPSAPTLSAVVCAPTSLSGASSSACTVTLTGPATLATTVTLSSGNTAVVVPPSVTVLAGSTTAQFFAVASSSLNTTVTIAVALNGISKSTTLALTTSTFSLRVHAGGSSYLDTQGFTWSADTGYTGGNPLSTANTVAKTNAVPLYQTARYGPSGYSFTVPNGNYTVNLKFAEVSLNSIGQRVFSVTLNGAVVLPTFDIVAAAGGPLVAIDEPFPVTVTSGTIQIGFIQQIDLPIVNAIEIVQQGAPLSQTGLAAPTSFTPIYINAGGPAYTDPQGRLWSADQLSTGGSPWSTYRTIANTTMVNLYQTCRYGEFFYAIPMPNGNYVITLKFAELAPSGAGTRLFNVQINGVPVLTNFDIVAAIGAPFVAVDKTFAATVANGILMLGFTQGQAAVPLVSAIQIARAN